MVDLAAVLDKHLIPDLASIVLEYCQLERVDEMDDGYRYLYTKLFGKKHGKSKGYYPTGELWCSRHYVNAKLHGEAKGYYKNGKLKYSHNWINGKQHGEYKYYNRNGELSYTWHYVNDVLQ